MPLALVDCLSLFDENLTYVMNGHISLIDDGFEEFFMTGAVITHEHVPVPGGAWLLLAGALGLGARPLRTSA